ncbi:MAG: carboxymuconolactone decarboxylase family protein [Rhodobacteraceae bacterium]|nr:carboxymuconolactone decarboxylase family protein [Paracoccaceae bacterium]
MDWQKFLDETIQSTGVYHKEASELFAAFSAMGKAAKKSDALDEKTKELIALGIAISTRCDPCIAYHMKALVRLKTSREELCEALEMISYMGGGPSISYSAKALEAYDQFSQ